jgi:hypothetical protein
MTDLIERAKAALEGGDVFNEWLLFHPIARALIDTTAERDALRERVAELEADVEKIRGLETKWQQAFAAQSQKLQSVLHIPGVRAALQKDTPND